MQEILFLSLCIALKLFQYLFFENHSGSNETRDALNDTDFLQILLLLENKCMTDNI